MKGIWTYKELLLPTDKDFQFSLGEGNTPLVRSKQIGKQLGLNNLFFKLENLNPTGSYKDRFAAMAISNCLQKSTKGVLATSSGNTGAALAAYTAAADLNCIICLVDGAPFGKLQQMGVYGADLLMIKDFGISDECTVQVMQTLRKVAKDVNCSVEISAYKFSPVGMTGVQTISFEIAENLPTVDHVFVPAGGGGLYLSIVLGFSKWRSNIDRVVDPVLYCVQPIGNDTISSVLKNRSNNLVSLSESKTKISGLQVPSLLDAQVILDESQRNKCEGVVVDDEDVFLYQKLLAQKEGIYCEPAGAVSLVGLKKALEAGNVDANENVVCLITGNGYKDQRALDNIYKKEDCIYVEELSATESEILKKFKD